VPRGATVAWHVAWPRGAKPPQVPHSDSPGIHELTRPLSTLFTALDPRRARSTMTTERVSVITDIIDFIILCVVPAQPKSCSWHVGHGRWGPADAPLTTHGAPFNICATRFTQYTRSPLPPRAYVSFVFTHMYGNGLPVRGSTTPSSDIYCAAVTRRPFVLGEDVYLSERSQRKRAWAARLSRGTARATVRVRRSRAPVTKTHC